jgi:hypothetical protein
MLGNEEWEHFHITSIWHLLELLIPPKNNIQLEDVVPVQNVREVLVLLFEPSVHKKGSVTLFH